MKPRKKTNLKHVFQNGPSQRESYRIRNIFGFTLFIQNNCNDHMISHKRNPCAYEFLGKLDCLILVLSGKVIKPQMGQELNTANSNWSIISGIQNDPRKHRGHIKCILSYLSFSLSLIHSCPSYYIASGTLSTCIASSLVYRLRHYFPLKHVASEFIGSNNLFLLQHKCRLHRLTWDAIFQYYRVSELCPSQPFKHFFPILGFLLSNTKTQLAQGTGSGIQDHLFSNGLLAVQ